MKLKPPLSVLIQPCKYNELPVLGNKVRYKVSCVLCVAYACVWMGGCGLNKSVLFVCYIPSQFNPLYRFIGHILPQFNLLPTGGRHFILWVCLLLLVGRWLMFELWSIPADTVVQQNSSQASNNKRRGTSHHSCNFQSSNCTAGSRCVVCGDGSRCVVCGDGSRCVVCGEGSQCDNINSAVA